MFDGYANMKPKLVVVGGGGFNLKMMSGYSPGSAWYCTLWRSRGVRGVMHSNLGLLKECFCPKKLCPLLCPLSIKIGSNW